MSRSRRFAKIALPFTIADFGGWKRAYPEIIEGPLAAAHPSHEVVGSGSGQLQRTTDN